MYSTKKKQYVMFLFFIEMHEQWTKKNITGSIVPFNFIPFSFVETHEQ